jgi:hypothetical protein
MDDETIQYYATVVHDAMTEQQDPKILNEISHFLKSLIHK